MVGAVVGDVVLGSLLLDWLVAELGSEGLLVAGLGALGLALLRGAGARTPDAAG